MSKLLKNLQTQSIKLYKNYRANDITEKEYLRAIRPLDKEIEAVELKLLSYHLRGHLSFEKPSLKRLR